MTDRRLVLIRHAKAEQGPIDLGRALSPRGHRDARGAGIWLAGNGIAPDRVVVSPSRRTVQTWSDIAAQLDEDTEPLIDGRLYENSIDALLEVVHDTPDNGSTLALVGHNPSIGSLAYLIDDELGDADERSELREGYPTSAIAVFTVVTSWADVGPNTGRLHAFTVARG